MRKLLFVMFGAVAVVTTLSLAGWDGGFPDLSLPSLSADSSDKDTVGDVADEELVDYMSDDYFYIDTVMYAKGHTFGSRGDITCWRGWYFDSVCVGTDLMLTYDSVGPSKLRLSLVTRDLTVDLGDPDAEAKIKALMQPLDGFTCFERRYEQCLDSATEEDHAPMEYRYMAYFTFVADCPDSAVAGREKINRFICDLTGVSEIEKAKVPALAAFYAGFNRAKSYRPVYSGKEADMQGLSDFLADRAFENWKRDGEFGLGSSALDVCIRSRVANRRFVTFSKYEYDREGTGHGMYTETFHTLDLKSGEGLTNADIFKAGSLDKVKYELFGVMARDPRFTAANDGVKTARDVARVTGRWQYSDITEEDSGEESRVEVELPEGALTATGVVFSFQPYEIGCFAEGAYHFIVPYSRLRPYLTPTARRLVSGLR